MTTRHAQPCRCADCIDGENRVVRPAAIASAAPSSLTDAQIGRHMLRAADCPPDSKVMLVSAIKRLRATAQAPAIQAPEVVVTDEMVTAYLKANDEYWRRTDELPGRADKWRKGTPQEATRESLIAALAITPSAAVSAGPDPDGERYRKLRDKSHPLGGRFEITTGEPPVHLYGEQLDAVLDAMALAPTQPQQGTGSGS